jgi:hypothetical protein
MEKKKKEWVQPELVVLVVGKPEENILIVCKTMEGLDLAQDWKYGFCYQLGCIAPCDSIGDT